MLELDSLEPICPAARLNSRASVGLRYKDRIKESPSKAGISGLADRCPRLSATVKAYVMFAPREALSSGLPGIRENISSVAE